MMPRGMRIIEGREAARMAGLIDVFRQLALVHGYEEVMFPSVWEQRTFVDKAGPEVVGQMYAFPDKKGRPLTLIPEVTAIVEEIWREFWSKRTKRKRIFYVNRCYRYERPQAGRYREFTQFGVEDLGEGSDAEAVRELARTMLYGIGVKIVEQAGVKRGLDYYVEDGFEFEAPILGAQKQVAGGGRYATGVGFAIGIDRLILAQSMER